MLVTYGILEKVTKILIVKIKIAGLLCRYSENQADLKQKDTITKQVNGQKSWQKPPIILQSGNRINIVIRKDIAGRVRSKMSVGSLSWSILMHISQVRCFYPTFI